MGKEHVVLGTGPLGLAVIDELLKQGKNVVAVNRSGKTILPENVQLKKCDLTDGEKTRDLLKNAFVVYNCVGLPYEEWESTLPKIMKNIIIAAEEHQSKIVYADNLYAYGPQHEPFNENMPYNLIGTKTKVRAEIANMLMKATKEGRVRATIGRGSDFYGPRVRNAILGERVFQHLLDGKPVELIGDPDKLHSHLFIEDFARGLVILGEEEKADGEVWHIPHPTPTTTRELVEEIAACLGKKPKYRIANKQIVSLMGLFNPVMKEFKELLYQTTKDFTVNSNKFTSRFSFQITPHKEAIQKTCEWYIAIHK